MTSHSSNHSRNPCYCFKDKAPLDPLCFVHLGRIVRSQEIIWLSDPFDSIEGNFIFESFWGMMVNLYSVEIFLGIDVVWHLMIGSVKDSGSPWWENIKHWLKPFHLNYRIIKREKTSGNLYRGHTNIFLTFFQQKYFFPITHNLLFFR